VEAVSGGAFVLFTLVKAAVFFTLMILTIIVMVLMERKGAAFIQDRSGPNRVGPWGTLQAIADGLKGILKEEVWPQGGAHAFFLLAPFLAIVTPAALFAVIPFAAPLPTKWGLVEVIVADAPIGFLYILAVGSIGVYSIVLAGWSSNSKYSFLGGLRGSAQMVSYEIALALSLVPLILLAGDVRIPELVSMQQSFPGQGPATAATWFIMPLFLSFFFFLVSGLAETNRLPFDLPEAEAELIAGYHTEYSAMKFMVFYMGEYIHVLITAALVVVFFLGGWDIPFWAGDNIRVLDDGTVLGDPTWWKTILTLAAFTVKTLLVVFVFIWIRWTVPRFRYDQLMDLGWKFLIEAVTAYIVIIAGAILVLEALGVPMGRGYAGALFGLNLLLAFVLFVLLDRGALIRGASYRARLEARRRVEARRRKREVA